MVRNSAGDGAVSRATSAGAISPRGIKRLRSEATLAAFATPGIILLTLFHLLPVVIGAAFSLTRWRGAGPATFVGLENFSDLLTDPDVHRTVLNTAAFTVLVVVIQNILGLALAILLNQKLPFISFFRAIVFMPVLLSSAVVGLIWSFIFNPINGVLRQGFSQTGLSDLAATNWLGDPGLALVAVTVVVIWQYVGYTMVLYLAGLQAVPTEQYEAASIDGANSSQRFRFVTVPNLAPAFTISLTISLIGSLRLFDLVWILTRGGPDRATETITVLIYNLAFGNARAGTSAALGVLLAVLVITLVAIQLTVLKRREQPA